MRYIIPDSVTNVIISPKRAGTTWLQVLLGSYLYVAYGLSQESLMHLAELTRGMEYETVITHDPQRLDVDPIPVEKEYQGKRIAVLLRDPRDVVVSRFLLDHYRHKTTGLEADDYAQREMVNILDFYNTWLICDKSAFLDYTVLRYEDLVTFTRDELTRLVGFLGYKIDQRGLNRALEFASFENMKRLERESKFHDFYKVSDMLPVDNQEAMRTRRGKVGGYRDYLDGKTIDWINARVLSYPAVRELYG